MTNNIHEIFKSINTSAWGDRSVDQFAPWERRDILSAQQVPNYTISVSEQTLVDTIIKNIHNKTDFSWNLTDLSILGEAEIQKILRKKGFEIQVSGMNAFPNSCKELQGYINSFSILTVATELVKHYKDIQRNTIYNANILFKKYSGAIWIVSLAVGMYIYYTPMLLISALITGYIVSNCMAMHLHEYWVHDLIKPRNRIIGFILDFITTILWAMQNRPHWRFMHSYHHIHWKTNKDHDAGSYATPWLQYLLFGQAAKYSHLGGFSPEPSLLTEAENTANLLPEEKFLVQYQSYIRIATHLLVLLILGPAIYIYFLLLMGWMQTRYIVYFNEIVTHHNNKTREEEADTPYIFPICTGTAYHKTHHMHADILVVGPGWVKYFNVQYYFVKLLYNINGRMPDKY
jgi:hypothetical protein